MNYDANALIRCLTGIGSEGDFEKVAIIGAALRGADVALKYVGKKILTSPKYLVTRVARDPKTGKAIRKATGGVKREFAPMRSLITVPTLYGGIQAGRSAAVQPVGYRPNVQYYQPGVRVR